MLMNSNEYLNIVESIKQDIRTAQYRATVSVNRELLVLYHSIGGMMSPSCTTYSFPSMYILPASLQAFSEPRAI